MKITHYGDVETERELAFPSRQRQLDMIWRALDLLSRGEPLSDDVIAMIDRIEELKKKFPYPPPGAT